MEPPLFVFGDDNMPDDFIVVNGETIKIGKVHDFKGFIYMGDTYFYIKDVADYLKLRNRYGINWSRMHELFYNALRMLRINPDHYPIPLNHSMPVNGKIKISKNERDLPEWIMGQVFTIMAQSKEDNYIYTNFIQVLQDQFKNLDNIIDTENKLHPDATYFEGRYPEMNNDKNNVHPEAQYSIQKMNELGIDLKVCPDGENQIKGFVKNGDIYLNSEDVAYMIGLDMETDKGYYVVRWNLMYKYFSTYAIMFGYNAANQGFDFRNPSNKAGFHSKYEVMVPEYIPYKIVFSMANNLHNPRACKFRFDIIFTVLDYFIKNAPPSELNNVEYVNSIKPLIMQYRQNYPQLTQMINTPPQLVHYFPANPIPTGCRPAIPFWNGTSVQKTTMAYQMPSPEEIQKNLDAQKSPDGRELKEVVRFVKIENKEE